MTQNNIDQITSYHAHIYYDAETKTTAEEVRAAMQEAFPEVVVGRWHDRPVGPHPEWSSQVAFRADKFARIMPWLSLNSQGLTVFVHPNTGDGWADHADHAMWVGSSRVLNLEALRPFIKSDGSLKDDHDEE